MGKKSLKRKLNYLTVPPCQPDEIDKTIEKAKQIVLHPERIRMTNLQFFWNQIRFIRKDTWFIKILITIFLSGIIFSQEISADSWLWPLIAIFGPLMCLVNVNELCNIYQPGMLEIQLASKNSLGKVFMVRLIVFGIVDIIALASLAITITSLRSVDLWQILLYATAPYNLMCLGCMMILNRQYEENTLLYCTTWGMLLVFSVILCKTIDKNIFSEEKAIIWVAAGAVAILGTVWECKRLMYIAGGNLDEVKYGTFV